MSGLRWPNFVSQPEYSLWGARWSSIDTVALMLKLFVPPPTNYRRFSLNGWWFQYVSTTKKSNSCLSSQVTKTTHERIKQFVICGSSSPSARPTNAGAPLLLHLSSSRPSHSGAGLVGRAPASGATGGSTTSKTTHRTVGTAGGVQCLDDQFICTVS